MDEKVTDLIYSVRQLLEAIHEAGAIDDDDVKDCVLEVTTLLDQMTEFEIQEDI